MRTTTDKRLAPVVSVLAEHAARHDADASFPVESLEALREHHLMSLMVPAQFGGGGGSLETYVEVVQELAAGCLSTAQIYAMHVSHLDAIVRFGSAELKADVLRRVSADELYIASATTERGASLFSAHAPLVADRDGLVFERTAPVVTGGVHADGFLISVRASEASPEHEVSLVYVDRGDVEVEFLGEWDTLGMRATESVGMVFKGRTSERSVVGGHGRFAEVARESMIPASHLGWSASWLGAARGAFGELVRSLSKSAAAVDGSELLHERLARIRLDLELVSAYLTRVREEIEQARQENRSLAQPRIQLQVNALKICASDLTFRAVDHMVQLAGLRLGYMRQSPIALERHFRDLRSASLNHANDGLRVGVGAMCLLDHHVSLI